MPLVIVHNDHQSKRIYCFWLVAQRENASEKGLPVGWFKFLFRILLPLFWLLYAVWTCESSAFYYAIGWIIRYNDVRRCRTNIQECVIKVTLVNLATHESVIKIVGKNVHKIFICLSSAKPTIIWISSQFEHIVCLCVCVYWPKAILESIESVKPREECFHSNAIPNSPKI